MQAKCNVYRCANKAQTYLYLKMGHCIEDLPSDLRQLLGELSQILHLDLNDTSKLAQVKTSDVIENLNEHGFFLQMPPGKHLKLQTPGTRFIQ